MTDFHATLLEQTADARHALLATPIIQGALQRGEVSLPSYVAFLTEAYHHVRHTVPLLQAMKAALPARHAWLQAALDEYIALLAADAIQKPLALPDSAFSYLRSHGTLDREHTAHFELLMDQIDDPADQAAIVHAARAFFRLYGEVFRGLPLPRREEALA
jgi:hypothetical protein